jgi:NADPH:quinone reductase-like Zn-dependent oxidoreductase
VVQLASRAGAYVVVLVSSVAKGDELLRIGADEVVTEVSDLSSPVYGVIENIGGQTLVDAWNHLAPARNTCFSRLRIGAADGLPALQQSWAQRLHRPAR